MFSEPDFYVKLSVIFSLAGTPLRVCDLVKLSYFVRVFVLSA